ncbi:unnamed protein product [Closterium sp. NIES-53]
MPYPTINRLSSCLASHPTVPRSSHGLDHQPRRITAAQHLPCQPVPCFCIGTIKCVPLRISHVLLSLSPIPLPVSTSPSPCALRQHPLTHGLRSPHHAHARSPPGAAPPYGLPLPRRRWRSYRLRGGSRPRRPRFRGIRRSGRSQPGAESREQALQGRG